jgi:hypothetical protein
VTAVPYGIGGGGTQDYKLIISYKVFRAISQSTLAHVLIKMMLEIVIFLSQCAANHVVIVDRGASRTTFREDAVGYTVPVASKSTQN